MSAGDGRVDLLGAFRIKPLPHPIIALLFSTTAHSALITDSTSIIGTIGTTTVIN